MRKLFLSERNIVVVLFVMVFVIFSLAHEDTKEFEKRPVDSHLPLPTSSLDTPDNADADKKAKDITPIIDLR